VKTAKSKFARALSAADLYRYMLPDTGQAPEFANADYRLGELDSTTPGFRLGPGMDHGRPGPRVSSITCKPEIRRRMKPSAS
jgi:hypothetical protein